MHYSQALEEDSVELAFLCSLVTLKRGAWLVLKHFLGGMQRFMLV